MKTIQLIQKSALITLFNFILALNQASAHGEDKPGPHGGFIRMPGAFHTELVIISNQKFKLYLLDMNWKNPTVHNSSAEVKVRNEKKEVDISCEIKANYYECTLPEGYSLDKASAIAIKAKRENSTVGVAIYELPLKLFSHHGV